MTCYAAFRILGDKSVDKYVTNFYYLYIMTTKMYSFRLNKELMDSAKKIAGKMDMSLSFFIRYLLKENFEKGNKAFLTYRDEKVKVLREISSEIKKLRSDLRSLLKDKG